MRRPWRGVAFYMNGPAFVIAIVTFPFVLLQNLAGYLIAAGGVIATWPWWRPSGRVRRGEVVTRGVYIPRRRTLALEDVRLFEVVLVSDAKTWEGVARPCGGVTAVMNDGERVPIVDSASWSTAHAERWLGYLQLAHMRATSASADPNDETASQ
jgi:hypothetical protein